MKIKCGNLGFDISYNESWEIPSNHTKFIKNDNDTELHYNIEFVDNIEDKKEEIISRRNDIIVSKTDKNLESRYLIIRGDYRPYAYYKEQDIKNITISVLRERKDMFTLDAMFWSLFGLEKHLIKKESVILHCCYLNYKGHGILFSGPSGIGKSTQARLWEKYRDAKIINGDRSLLTKEENDWYANGWPVCGSSEICINEKNKIGSIVFLNQGEQNEVVKLSKIKAIKKIISELTINYWNQEFVDKAISIAEDIGNNVNVYELTCRIDEDAVDTLEHILKENETWMD